MGYFPLLYRLQHTENYLLWISDDKDSVAVDADGFVPSFRTFALLQEFVERKHYRLETEEPKLHDLDLIAISWTDTSVNCEAALAAWNLFSDVSASVPELNHNFRSLDSQCPLIYDKLFWGNNLPSMTPEGERYLPEWSAHELHSLAQIMASGLDLFISVVRQWNPQRLGG
jgi:hypothetical protein